MKVLFLCGGTGKRMFPITEDKFLLKFMGKTLLERQIEIARQAGLSEFVIVGNNNNMPQIKEKIGGTAGIRAEMAIQEQPLGIANALESASQFLDGEIIIVNPNDVFEQSAYTTLLEARQRDSASSYILGYEVNDYFPGGYLVVGKKGELKSIVEKPEKGQEPSNMINILLHLHTEPKRILEYVTSVQTERDDVYECALDTAARENHKIRVVPYSGSWNAIKYPWHIFNVVRYFLDQSSTYISPSARISERALIEGKVIIDDNARVFENVVIRGPAYIGANTVIGTNSLVRDYSHIGSNCVVGFSTEVKGSYISDRCWFHMNYVGDCIIGEGCSFGANTVFANWRFDEKNVSVKIEGRSMDSGLEKFGAIVGQNCKTGVNVSVMPGVKIGPNSIIASHVCLTDDLEADKMIVCNPEQKILKNIYKASEEKTRKADERMKGLRCAG
jgi:bifunctional UDP-N-acetylglucosamine pyrophosphorylase/glucosamine-1-phosphate N-acetyltransferase